MSKDIAIVPGSFDPITNGHIDIIKKASKKYGSVFVAIMINSEKEYMFTLEERTAIAKAALQDVENVTVVSSKGWLWELAQELDAIAIVKGYRNEKDLKYELEMAKFNELHAPNTKTVLIKSEKTLENISSTIVREKIKAQQSLEGFLPHKAILAIEKIKEKKNL